MTVRGDHLRRAADLAVLFLLVVVPAFQLVPVYGGYAPLRAMAAGALLVALVLLAADAFRVPSPVAVPAAALVLVLLGPVAAGVGVGDGGAWVSASTVSRLLRGCVTGWRDMLTVATPIGGTGDLLVPPLLIGAIAMTAAGLLASGRRHSLALLPVALAFLGVALLGQRAGADTAVAVLAGVSLVVGLGWLSVRRASRVKVIGPGPARWRRPAMAGVLLICGGLVAASVGGSGGGAVGHRQDRLALRTGLAVPVDPRSLPSPLTGFRAAVADDFTTIAFRVTGVRPGDRLRLASLDAYDGQIFSATADEGPFARVGAQVDRRSAQDAGTVPAGAARSLQVQFAGNTGPYTPVLGELDSVTFGGARAGELTDGFRYSATASTGLLPDGWRSGDSVSESVTVPALPTPAQLAVAPLAPEPMSATPPIPDALRVAAAKYAGGRTAPGAQLTAIAESLAAEGYFSDGRTGQLRSPSGHGLDRLLGMVSGAAMIGDQEQYAALMAVLARSLGIPARVAVGYQVAAGASGTVPITGRDMTAWVEAPFQGWGWVAFDPTPQRSRTTVDKTPQAQAGRHVADNRPPPAIAGADSATVQSGGSQQPKNVSPPSPVAAPAAAAPVRWWVWSLLALGATALLTAVPIALILGLKTLRRRRRRAAPSPSARARAAWRELLDVAVDAGFRPGKGQTRSEIATEMAGTLAVDSGSMARVADAAEFSPLVLEEKQAGEQWESASERIAELLHGLGARSRLRARLSVASFRQGLR